MTDNANPQAGATGPLDYDGASAAFENYLEGLDAPPEEPPTAEAEDEPAVEDSDDEDTTAEAEEVEAEEEPDSEEAPSYQSVDELAEATGMSLDEFLGQIKVTAKIDGQDEAITLSELRDGYQRQQSYTRKTQELAEQRKALEAAKQQVHEEANSRLKELGAMVGALEQQLIGEYQSVNWQELRQTDPAEFAALRAEYQERANRIEQMKAHARGHAERQQHETTQQQQAQYQQIMQREAQALLTAIPEWSDQSVAQREKGELREYMVTNGYSPEEVNSLLDHRAVRMIRNAMLFDKQNRDVKAAKKKVAPLRKVTRPGSKDEGKTTASQKSRDKAARLRKTGRVDDAAAIFYDLI